jgi:hypothetical protein
MPNRTSYLPRVRRTIFVCAEPYRICQCCSELSHIKAKRALRTWLLVRVVVQLAMNQSVVAVSHVIVLITAAHRTSKPVKGLFQKAPRMHGLLDEEHRDIVIKTGWGNSGAFAASLLALALGATRPTRGERKRELPSFRSPIFVNWIR